MLLPEALNSLESMMRFQIALLAKKKLFVHAGVVGWKGRAIVIPGHSFSGKTTLVSALVRAGAEYYSDEFAVFDHHGLVHPFPKALNIRGKSGQSTEKCPVETLGGQRGTEALPVGMIVVTEYHAGTRWRPRRLSQGDAVLALLAHTVRAQVAPEFALPTLGRVAEHAQGLSGKRGEAIDLARLLLRPAGPTHQVAGRAHQPHLHLPHGRLT
jgi:hypothetical protein